MYLATIIITVSRRLHLPLSKFVYMYDCTHYKNRIIIFMTVFTAIFENLCCDSKLVGGYISNYEIRQFTLKNFPLQYSGSL